MLVLQVLPSPPSDRCRNSSVVRLPTKAIQRPEQCRATRPIRPEYNVQRNLLYEPLEDATTFRELSCAAPEPLMRAFCAV